MKQQLGNWQCHKNLGTNWHFGLDNGTCIESNLLMKIVLALVLANDNDIMIGGEWGAYSRCNFSLAIGGANNKNQ